MYNIPLENFIALYQARSVTKAAESLYLSRQALSQSLKTMEKELGFPLFTRTNSGLVPTKEGEILYRYACEALKLKEEAFSQIQALRQKRVLSLALHVIYYSRTQLRSIKDACCRITGFNPEIINISTSREGLDLVLEGKADLAATYKPPDTAGVKCIRGITQREPLLLMKQSDPLSRLASVDFLSDLKDREVIFLSSEIMNSVSPSLQAQNATPSLLAGDRELLWESLETDGAVMIIQAQSRSVFLQKDITVRRLSNFPVKLGFYLLTGENQNSPALSQLTEYLTGEFQEQRESENKMNDHLFHTGLS